MKPFYVTFYSYKGGVGRTMALANVAVALARQKRRVVIWELDLEAPGLLSIPFFQPNQYTKKPKGGTLNLLADPPKENNWGAALTEHMLTHKEFDGRLRVLPAGPEGDGYTPLFSRVNWDRLFGKDSEEGSIAFARMKEGIDAFTPEFVLIDSRTGITDIGGICTVQLADMVVMVYNLGHQNLRGTQQVMAAIGDHKKLKAYRDKELDIVKVASMVPADYPDLAAVRREAAKKTTRLKKLNLQPDFEIPFHPYLLLEELIWVKEYPDQPLAKAYEALAKRIHDAAPVNLEVRIEDKLELRDRGESQRRGRTFEDKVAEVLRLMGYDVERDVNVGGYQTDFIASRQDAIQSLRLVGECKAHRTPRGNADVTDLNSRVLADRTKHPTSQGLLVSVSGFTKDADEAAKTFGISLKSYDDLLNGLVDVGPAYLAGLLQDYEGKEIERLYVPHNVVTEASPKHQPLDEYVDNWLGQREQPFLALLGDFGTGKTWFTRRLAARLAKRYREDPAHARYPLLVNLKSITRGGTLESVLSEHFQQAGRQVNIPALLYLLNEGRYTLLFDSFDEMLTRLSWRETLSTFRELTRAAQGNAKVLLACRTHYFKNEDEVRQYVRGEVKSAVGEAGATELYKEVSQRAGFAISYLPEFGEEQVAEFVRRAVPKEPEKTLARIREIDGLKEIAARPIFLEMVIQELPRLVREGGVIRLARLYDGYTKTWIQQRDWQSELSPEARLKLVEELARELWQQDGARLHFSEMYNHLSHLLRGKISTNKELEVADADVRTASFLTRDAAGNYGFSHRSFLEFFVARRMAGRLDQMGEALRLRRLSPPVIAFLVELSKPADLARGLAAVLQGAYERGVSENALLIAKAADCVPEGCKLAEAELDGLDLRGVSLPGADLAGASLVTADLTGAVLTGASLRAAKLMGARMDGCTAAGLDLRDADLEFASLLRADLYEARTQGALFSGTAARGAKLPARPQWKLGRPSEGEPRAVVQGMQAESYSVAFSPDGRCVAAASSALIRVYDLITGSCRVVLDGHKSTVRSVAWSPDGSRLASASYDNSVRLWDAATGECLEIHYTFPDGGWLVMFPRGGRKDIGNAAGLQRLTFAEGWALYPWYAFPELAELSK